MSIVDGLPFSDDKKEYIVKVLDPILQELVSDVLAAAPDDPIQYMIDWMRKRSQGGGPAARRQSLRAINFSLTNELKHVTGSLAEAGQAIAGGKAAKEEEEEDDEESEEEDDDDDCDEIPESFRKPEQQLGRARQSVSAEAYGKWNQKKAFEAPKHPKTEEQKGRLAGTLQKSFMFSALEPEDMETILLAMKEVSFEAGAKVITEGENGDYLFVIEKGSLDCIKRINGEDKVVKTCVPGDVFGELALLYNCPRAASVVSKDACVCWQLDRESFNHIVKDAAMKRREKYDGFLKSVSLLASLGDYERSQLADVLKGETFAAGDVIVRQSEPGDRFYIVEAGAVYATKSVDGGEAKRVMDYEAGDYFGELALLKNQPRAASVIVGSDTAKVLSMSRATFTKMLGPLQHILANRVYA